MSLDFRCPRCGRATETPERCEHCERPRDTTGVRASVYVLEEGTQEESGFGDLYTVWNAIGVYTTLVKAKAAAPGHVLAWDEAEAEGKINWNATQDDGRYYHIERHRLNDGS